MDLILADANGIEERVIFAPLDLDIGETNDFQITISYGDWDGSFDFGKRIFIPGTEYGGIIKAIESATNTDQIHIKGYTWRGYLAHRFIIPPAGADYYTVSGELNEVIRQLVGDIFTVPEISTGVSVSYQFERFCSVEDGLTAMLASVGYRLDIKYVEYGTFGVVEVQALPAVTYGHAEFSQDSKVDFSSKDNRMGVNHLICLGTGELHDRLVIHLYADADGNISKTQTIFGIDEICEVYDNSGAEADTLESGGADKLKEKINSKTFAAAVKDVARMDLYLGDIVTGRDIVTGNTVTQPITQKTVKFEDGTFNIDYKIKGEDKS